MGGGGARGSVGEIPDVLFDLRQVGVECSAWAAEDVLRGENLSTVDLAVGHNRLLHVVPRLSRV